MDKTSEEVLLEAIDEYDNICKKYAVVIDLLRHNLINCKHTRTIPFTWEYDNGYGIQKMITGILCIACKYKKHWPEAFNWYF